MCEEFFFLVKLFSGFGESCKGAFKFFGNYFQRTALFFFTFTSFMCCAPLVFLYILHESIQCYECHQSLDICWKVVLPTSPVIIGQGDLCSFQNNFQIVVVIDAERIWFCYLSIVFKSFLRYHWAKSWGSGFDKHRPDCVSLVAQRIRPEFERSLFKTAIGHEPSE